MKIADVRNWLGIFFLGTTGVLGAYIILFQGTHALPIPTKDANCAFQIIIPTLVGQLTVAFRWIANPPADTEEPVALPRWAVIGPPSLVGGILIATIATLVLDAGKSLDGGAVFRNAVTFCVSLLSASTAFIVSRVFAAAAKNLPPPPQAGVVAKNEGI